MRNARRSIVRSIIVGLVAASFGLGLGQRAHIAGAANVFTVYPNISYCTLNGITEAADFYYPTALPATPLPVVLYFHGGTDGNYKGDITSTLPHLQLLALNALISSGYMVVSLNWASGSSSHSPDTLTWEFAKCAVRTIRANATSLDVDPTRIAAWGDSNGAGIATILGTTTTAQGWDVGPYLSVSSRVESVVDWCNGGTGWQYVSAGDAPELIQIGTADTANYPSASWFAGLFQQAGVPVQFQPVQNAMHQFLPVSTTVPISPSPTALAQQVVTFLNTYVKNNPSPKPQ